MNCIFNCNTPIETSTFPMCSSHLMEFGLELQYVSMNSLIQEPRGLGPFFVTLPDTFLPKLYFKQGNIREGSSVRSLYLPTFRNNHVIFHSLKFNNFVGSEQNDCPTVTPVEYQFLEDLKNKDKKEKYVNNIVQEQTDAQSLLATTIPAPVASPFLIRLLDGYQDILRSSVFATTTSDASVLKFNQQIFTKSYPTFLNKIMENGGKSSGAAVAAGGAVPADVPIYAEYNMQNTIWLGLVYNLYPERIEYQQDLLLESGHNCELKQDIGLVATRDIYPGEFLVLKGKSINLNDLMCYLPPPTEVAIKKRKMY